MNEELKMRDLAAIIAMYLGPIQRPVIILVLLSLAVGIVAWSLKQVVELWYFVDNSGFVIGW